MFSLSAPIKQIYVGERTGMTIQTRVSQDRRNTSRVIARMDCHFSFGGVSHEAVIVDLSLKGAFISAKFLPPNGSIVMVRILPPSVKKEVVFKGQVIRGTWAMSEHGKLGRFGIRFVNPPTDLLILFSKLSS